MKKNTNKYLKTNLIGFILGGLLISGVAVYAAITFPSKDVSYENSTSGLKSTDVQGAIDELYKTCTQTLADQIIEKGKLEKDPYECRYFFTGANPNNYITFNDQTWQIMSAECDGTIKIMGAGGNRVWNEKRTSIWPSNGEHGNDWTIATLNTYLNEDYYNGLTSTAQSQIVGKDWSIGEVDYNDTDLSKTVNDEQSTKWNGKIALPTISEYIRSNSNKSNCGTMEQIFSNNDNCEFTSWMTQKVFTWWTLTSFPDYNYDYVYVVRANSGRDLVFNGLVNYQAMGQSYNVRATLYLNSDLKIIGGNGSESNPYILG